MAFRTCYQHYPMTPEETVSHQMRSLRVLALWNSWDELVENGNDVY